MSRVSFARIPTGHILDANTAAIWRYEETSGSLIDATGNHTLPLTAGSYPTAVGQVGKARTPGTSSSIFIGAPSGGDVAAFLGDVTLEFWGYIGSAASPVFPAGYLLPFGFLGDRIGTGPANNTTFVALLHVNGSLLCNWESGNRINTQFGTPVSSFTLDAWHHFAAVRYISGGSAFVELYIDGGLNTVGGPVAAPTGGTANSWIVGGVGNVNSNVFSDPAMRHDDTRVSFVRRTPDEIAVSYRRGTLGA